MSLEIQIFEGGKAVSSAEVELDVFGKEYNETLVHQVVVAYQAAGRSGTKAQKSRAEVSGGGAKPWRQKGGGRARAGSSRSPLWRTGGVTFAAKNRSYEQKVNRKMYRVAMKSIFSELLRQNRISVNNDLQQLGSYKTKSLVSKLKDYADLSRERTLLVTDSLDENLLLSSRNLSNLRVITAKALNPVVLVDSHRVLVTSEALNQIQESLK